MMQKLLDTIEQLGYRDEDGTLLTNSLEWHSLRLKAKEVFEYAVQADAAAKLLEARVMGAAI